MDYAVHFGATAFLGERKMTTSTRGLSSACFPRTTGPSCSALIQVGAILAEQHVEWQASSRRHHATNMAATLKLDQRTTLELDAAKHEARH